MGPRDPGCCGLMPCAPSPPSVPLQSQPRDLLPTPRAVLSLPLCPTGGAGGWCKVCWNKQCWRTWRGEEGGPAHPGSSAGGSGTGEWYEWSPWALQPRWAGALSSLPLAMSPCSWQEGGQAPSLPITLGPNPVLVP